MYDQLSKTKSILCVLGVGFSVALCYVLHEKYYKDNLKKDCKDCKDR